MWRAQAAAYRLSRRAGATDLPFDLPLLVQHEVPLKTSRNVGTLLLGVWLVLTGLIQLVHLSFTGLSVLMAALALIAGLLVVIGR